MRKLIISVATAATLISVAGASSTFAMLSESHFVTPTMFAHQPVIRVSDVGHAARHGHAPLFMP
jgi:hypothetical protein